MVVTPAPAGRKKLLIRDCWGIYITAVTGTSCYPSAGGKRRIPSKGGDFYGEHHFIERFCGGSLLEKANTALKVVLENMQDPNTPWKKSRELNIKLTFSQNESRDDMAVDVSVTSKIAPVTAIQTRMAVGKDLRTGQVYAEEYGKQVKGQMSFADVLQAAETVAEPERVVVGEEVVDTETGEVIGKVMDFRTKEA